MRTLEHLYGLYNTLTDDKEVVIFLGAGASQEGKLNGEPFPGFSELIDEVLKDNGVTTPIEDRVKKSEKFKEIIKDWETARRLPKRLNKYLDGEPGPAHYYLAAIIIALYKNYNVHAIHITTNYDDLMSKAFSDLERNKEKSYLTKYFSLMKHITGSELEKFFAHINEHIKDGNPVILKLFGDLNSQSPILVEDDMIFEPQTKEQLKLWMRKPMIFIGYSFSDEIIKNLLTKSSGNAPIFVVNPDDINIKLVERSIKYINTTFMNFILDFLSVIEEKDSNMYEKIKEIIKPLSPQLAYPNLDLLKKDIKLCSEPSLFRIGEKLLKITIEDTVQTIHAISRTKTGPDFQQFIKENAPLLVIIGDSGMGKSTLLYQTSTQDTLNNNIISLFYDSHHIQAVGSLRKRLSQDFNCEEDKLPNLLDHINRIFSKENKTLIVMIDGISDSFQIDPIRLKSEIEELGSKLPPSIKIIYTCRRVYWDSFIKTEVPILSRLYFNSREFSLSLFSKEELKEAFKIYQDAYKFIGSYEDLSDEFKEKISDPLILRILAESFQGERLPHLASTVKIFKYYEDSLKRRFKNKSALMDFIYELVSLKLDEAEKNEQVSDQFVAREIRTNPKFLTLFQLLKGEDPLILLEDERILVLLNNEESSYRFSYDRFFEYLLGKEIGKRYQTSFTNNFAKTLNEKFQAYEKNHFSFLQSLKSQIVRNSIEDPNGDWSFYKSETLKLLLQKNNDAAIKNFTKEILRELTFEAEKDILDVLKEITANELEWKLLALDIAGDSPKIKPILIEGLFSGDKIFARRCIQILSVRNKNNKVRKDFEDSIVERIAEIEHLEEAHAVGLIYYTAAIFSLEDEVNNDPFIQVKLFWKRILLAIDNSLETAMKKIKEIVSTGFTKLFKEEGPIFSGDFSQTDPMEYIWKDMSSETSEIRTAALKMIQLVIDPNQPINIDLQEVIRFFGSSIKDWEYRNEPEKSVDYNYEFEYRIAQWLLLHRSHHKYEEVKQILDQFVKTGFWKNIDFALCTMKYILLIIHKNSKEIIVDGFNVMKRWTEKYRENEERFYSTLNKDDPFSINQIPILMTATIDTAYSYFSPEDGPVAYLKERLTSSNKNDVYLALLCVRDLWQNHPKKILSTLDTVANSEDIKINDWLGRILKEIYLVYPRFVEDFFYRNKMDPSKVQEIKNREDVKDSTGFEYSASPLLKQLFLSNDERRKLFAEWYQKIFTYKSTESYCRDLVEFILKQILS